MISVVGIRHRLGGDGLLPRTLRPRLADLSLGLLSSEDLLTCLQGWCWCAGCLDADVASPSVELTPGWLVLE